VKNITADVICENDNFDYEKGTNPYIKHKPALSNRGEMIGAYAIAFLIGGETHFEIMGSDEIAKTRNTSESKNSDYSPWKNWESEMWKKTVVRRLFKYLKKGLNEKLINLLQIDNEIIQADYQTGNETKNADKFSDFEIID
jgi:recombination protein RecT